MVLIISDPVQRKRWENHLNETARYHRNPDRFQQVIDLTLAGASNRQIRESVVGSWDHISRDKARGRRAGIL